MKRETRETAHVMEMKVPENAADTLKQVIGFLKLFLSETLAKRLVALDRKSVV